ncbi:hypothetical protein [uncultured Lactobacillus sp.]|uniref:hypothetical protein n=1 Tax=uncultured Lactobacillus sp. TaxID=153152 RepID=UPI0025E22A36|nr:hypothetical protein [uncultured Lactobacillus sp.]
MNNNLLISEPPLQVIPSLAVALKSVDKAVILQQIHYWLQRSKNIEDGHHWVFNTVKEWHQQFPWLAEKTVQRYLKDLCDKGLLITGNFNKANFDRTKWYRINYDALDKLANSKGTDSPNGKEPIVPIQRDSVTQPIPLEYTETTQENNNIKSKSDNLDKPDYEQEFNFLWNLYPKGKKQGKQLALRSYKRWRKLHKSNTFKQAKIQLKKYLKYIKVQHVQVQFIKAAKTWFGNIDDEYDISAPPVNQSYKPIQKTIEKGTDWSKQKPEVDNSINAEQLTDFFKKFEDKNGLT